MAVSPDLLENDKDGHWVPDMAQEIYTVCWDHQVRDESREMLLKCQPLHESNPYIGLTVCNSRPMQCPWYANFLP